MRIEYPSDGQADQLRQLWKLAFGDSDAFLDKFYACAYSPRRCRCVTENGHIAAALYWFDGAFAGQKIAYLYAVATHPDFRSRGFCRALMEDTHALLTAQGYAAAMLLPDGGALRRMYAGMGYRDCCTVSEFVCTASGSSVPLRVIGREEYARLRRQFLPVGGVIQEGDNLRYLETFAAFYSGREFLLAAAPDENGLHGIELLGDRDTAPGILRALGYERGHFRGPGAELPFAMFRPLTAGAIAPGYFGLVFD